MKELITLGLLSGISFVGAIGFLMYGLLKKGKTSLMLASLLCLLISLGSGATTIYKTMSKSYQKVAQLIKPRTGDKIYTELFGSPKNNCLKILDYQDQVLPKIDYAIWLHFKTCPKECSRILAEFEYSGTPLLSKDLKSETLIDWWNPSTMSDTIYRYEHFIDEGKNVRTLWISKDSTEVYCRDILD